jgi:hypothetical protein
MADYSTMSDADLMAMVKPPAQDYSKLSDADLMKMVKPDNKAVPLSDFVPTAISDIPREVGKTASDNLGAVQEGLSNRGSKGPIEGLMGTGKAILGGLGVVGAPITGALRSLIGHPMAQAEHAVGSVIAPEIAAKDNPQQMYQTAAGDVDTAMSAARPAGFTPKGLTVPTPVATPAPSVGDLKTASRSLYQDPNVTGLEIKPQPVANLSTKIENDLLQRGFRPKQAGGTFDEVKGLTPGPGVQSVNAMDIHSARKALGVYAREVDAVGKPTAEAAAATIAKEHLNDFLPNINQSDVVSGNAQLAAELMKEADSNWGAAKRGEKVDLQLTRADRQAAKSGSGTNIENAMRQKIASMLDNPARSVGFSDPEKAAMEEIVRGSTTRNVLRKVGKLGFGDGLSLLLHAGATIPTGGANIPVGIAGTVARKLGEHLTSNAGSRLSEAVRSRSPLAVQNMGQAAVARSLSPQISQRSKALGAALMSQPRSGFQLPGIVPANAQQNQ